MRMKKVLIVILNIFMVIGLIGNNVFAQKTVEPTQTPQSTDASQQDVLGLLASSAILIDAKSGMVLYEKNAYDKAYPASITKILTVYLACLNLDFDDVVTCTKEGIFGFDRASSHIFLDVDEQVTVRDLVYATMLQSANDAAMVLAIAISGSVDKFSELMNQTIKDMGLQSTNFVNPHGLPDDNHYTSAYDMAMITRQAMKNEQFKEVFSTATYEAQPTNKQKDIRYFAAGNAMIKNGEYYYEYATGGKTGYTEQAGYTMVTTASKGNMDLVAVVLNEAEGEHRYADTKKLFEYGFSKYKTVVLSGEEIGTKEVQIKKDGYLWADAKFSVDVNFNILLPADKNENALETNIKVLDENNPETIKAVVELTLDGKKIGEVEMNKDIEVYDISFENTTLKTIILVINLISVGVLLAFIIGHGVFCMRKDFQRRGY